MIKLRTAHSRSRAGHGSRGADKTLSQVGRWSLNGACAALLAGSWVAKGVESNVDPAKLPAAATQQIEFTRDIKPILAGHCLKCHSDEKPKSNFRLTNRE